MIYYNFVRSHKTLRVAPAMAAGVADKLWEMSDMMKMLENREAADLGCTIMFYLAVKAALSGILAAIVSEIAKRSPAFGALVASLPLISIMAVIWLWRDTGDNPRIASHMEATFWYVLPSLPMFLMMPAMLRSGVGFWPSLAASCALTIVFYFIDLTDILYQRDREFIAFARPDLAASGMGSSSVAPVADS